MADRIVVRHQGVLHDLFTPQGTMKPVGGNDMKNGLILEEHMSPPGEFPETEFLTHIIVVKKGMHRFRCSGKRTAGKMVAFGYQEAWV
jgi:hypothetical protein